MTDEDCEAVGNIDACLLKVRRVETLGGLLWFFALEFPGIYSFVLGVRIGSLRYVGLFIKYCF